MPLGDQIADEAKFLYTKVFQIMIRRNDRIKSAPTAILMSYLRHYLGNACQ